MRTSNYGKKSIRKRFMEFSGIAGVVLLVFFVAFNIYYHVDHVEINESFHYSEDEIRKMVLRGPFKYNSLLASVFYTKSVDDQGYVEGYEVTLIDRNTIMVSVRERQEVGCIKFLDSYMYFDRNGLIVESSIEPDKRVPYFDGLKVKNVVLGEELGIRETVLNTAVSLVRTFEKNEMIPDHIEFDARYNITVQYGKIQAVLGEDSNLEDKMARLIAILPKLEGKKGIVHLENITATAHVVTFEPDLSEPEEEENEEGAEENDSDKEAAVGSTLDNNVLPSLGDMVQIPEQTDTVTQDSAAGSYDWDSIYGTGQTDQQYPTYSYGQDYSQMQGYSDYDSTYSFDTGYGNSSAYGYGYSY